MGLYKKVMCTLKGVTLWQFAPGGCKDDIEEGVQSVEEKVHESFSVRGIEF